MTKLVSVIMPVYNAEQFVSEAIQSVLNQSWTNWELIVINDGSRDSSGTIIEAFNDSRIRYFSQVNKGVSAARNFGMAMMRGDFFCFLDADDVLPDNSLKDRLAVFADESLQFVDGAVRVYDAKLENILYTWNPSFHGLAFDRLVRIDDRVFFGPSWMVRRKPGATYHMDESLRHCEDLFFYISLAHQGLYGYTTACTLYYRKNTGSAMSDLDGLARGYTLFREKVRKAFAGRISLVSGFLLFYRTRKIMFLSFISVEKYAKAFRYLFFGKI